MCVSAVTDEMIAEGNMEVTKTDSSINVKIDDKNGYPVSDTHYAYEQKSDPKNYDKATSKFYRMYQGQIVAAKLTIEMDYTRSRSPKVTAKDLGSMTKTEALALLNATMYDEYVITEVKEDKWGYVKQLTFDTKENVEEAARFAKSQEMAKQLIVA